MDVLKIINVVNMYSIIDNCPVFTPVNSDETDITVAITDVDGNIVLSDTVPNLYEVSLDDGYYYIEIGDTCYEMYVICGLKDCYRKMIDYIWCYDNTTCCKTNDDDYKAKINLYRNELARIVALMKELMFATDSSLVFLKDKGVFEEDPEYAKPMVSKLQDIVRRCGCTDDDDEWLEESNCE